MFIRPNHFIYCLKTSLSRFNFYIHLKTTTTTTTKKYIGFSQKSHRKQRFLCIENIQSKRFCFYDLKKLKILIFFIISLIVDGTVHCTFSNNRKLYTKKKALLPAVKNFNVNTLLPNNVKLFELATMFSQMKKKRTVAIY